MMYLSHSEKETEQLGERLGQALSPGTVVAYTGGLGMAKLRLPGDLPAAWLHGARHQPHFYAGQRISGGASPCSTLTYTA